MTVPDFKARKSGEPLVVLTAYSASIARHIAPHVDAILVGDSLGMVLYGFNSTLPVTLDMMILHTQAVRRGAADTLIITDLPFGSYQTSPQQAFESASRVLRESGADAVKLEGGEEMEETISFLSARGVPVMGHVGLMPQRINQMGKFRAQGRDSESAAQIMMDAKAVTRGGAFSVVIEGVLEPIAAAITKEISIPTIGIGASPLCDGQVLVSDDLFGLFSEFTPKFVRKYADIGNEITRATERFSADVRAREFPGEAECFVSLPAARRAS
jgi:3-methyl-2-oxobutanoate hydroxymethyltransferase